MSYIFYLLLCLDIPSLSSNQPCQFLLIKFINDKGCTWCRWWSSCYWTPHGALSLCVCVSDCVSPLAKFIVNVWLLMAVNLMGHDDSLVHFILHCVHHLITNPTKDGVGSYFWNSKPVFNLHYLCCLLMSSEDITPVCVLWIAATH